MTVKNNEIGISDRALIDWIFAKLDPIGFAAAMAAIFALGLFLSTVVLLLKGAPPDIPIGPHLQLLSSYLPGYSVTWIGSIIGAAYSSIIGAVVGYALALFWNLTHWLYLAVILRRLDVFTE